MDALSADTVFVAPHQPWRLAQTRWRLLPGLVFLGVFTLIGMSLGPYARVAAVSGVRSARLVEHALHGAIALPALSSAGAIAYAVSHPSTPNVDTGATADALAVAHQTPTAPFAAHPRRHSSPASPPSPHGRKGPLPPAYPGAHGDASTVAMNQKPDHAGAIGSPGKPIGVSVAQPPQRQLGKAIPANTGRPDGANSERGGGAGHSGHGGGGGIGHDSGHDGGRGH